MSTQQSARFFVLTLALSLFCCSNAGASVKSVKLSDRYYRSYNNLHCGWVKNDWVSGPARRKGRFTPYKYTIADLRRQLKSASSSQARSLSKRIKSLNKKMKAQNADYCNTLAAPASIGSLSSLPEVGSIVDSSQSSALVPATVSGTPPTIPALPGTGAREVFWRPGVIQGLQDGTPSEQQCSEYHIGQNDGESAGANTCVQVQTIGQTFEPVMIAFQPICFMRRGATQENIAAGGAQVSQGELPGDDISRLFDPPAGSQPRLVRIDQSGAETYFVRVFPVQQNNQVQAQYQATVWSCTGGATARRFWKVKVGNDGSFYSETGDLEDADSGGFETVINAYLTRGSGNTAAFDVDRNRSVFSEYQEPGGTFKFKNEVTISASQMLTRVHGVYSSGANLMKNYTVSDISGASIDELRFLQGAFSRVDQNGVNPPSASSGASEYRDTYYASAPGSDLVSLVQDVTFTGDSFWDSEPAVDLDMSQYSCTAQADIVLTLDLSNTTLQTALAPCNSMRLDEMLFCDSSDLVEAGNNWEIHCQL